MNEPTSIVRAEEYRSRALTATQPEDAAQAGSLIAAIARAAADPRIDVDKMQRLFEMREKLIERDAETQFIEAMARFKEHCPVVTKDMLNKQYDSKYTSIGNLVNTINPELGKFGLSANWELEQADKIKITCILSHVAGHKKRVSLSAAPDTSGQKNPIQQIKSTITYLELITFQAATAIATHGANNDDDGRDTDTVALVTDKQAADLEALITELGGNREKLLKYWKIGSFAQIPAKNYDAACKDVRAFAAARQRASERLK